MAAETLDKYISLNPVEGAVWIVNDVREPTEYGRYMVILRVRNGFLMNSYKYGAGGWRTNGNVHAGNVVAWLKEKER